MQVWVPNFQADGTLGLTCSGAPYAITGAGDLLALFRCVSCRYTFSPRHSDPRQRGSVGRVFQSHRVRPYYPLWLSMYHDHILSGHYLAGVWEGDGNIHIKKEIFPCPTDV